MSVSRITVINSLKLADVEMLKELTVKKRNLMWLPTASPRGSPTVGFEVQVASALLTVARQATTKLALPVKYALTDSRRQTAASSI